MTYKRFTLGDSFDSREAYLELEEIRDEQDALDEEIEEIEVQLSHPDLKQSRRNTLSEELATAKEALEDVHERKFPLEMMEQALEHYGFMSGVMLVACDDMTDHVREKTLDLIQVSADPDPVLIDLLRYVDWDAYAEDAQTNYTHIDADGYDYWALI